MYNISTLVLLPLLILGDLVWNISNNSYDIFPILIMNLKLIQELKTKIIEKIVDGSTLSNDEKTSLVGMVESLNVDKDTNIVYDHV